MADPFKLFSSRHCGVEFLDRKLYTVFVELSELHEEFILVGSDRDGF